MKVFSTFFIVLCTVFAPLQAQVINRTWKAMGVAVGNQLVGSNEEAKKIIRTPDGNYLVIGYVEHGQVGVITRGGKDGLVMKVTADGDVLWAMSTGGTANDEFVDVVYYDGYYYCVGTTYSWGANAPRYSDIFLVKVEDLETSGAVSWAMHFGDVTSAQSESGIAITDTPHTGVLLVGNSNANLFATNSDVVAIRVLPNGFIGFAKKYHFPLASLPESSTPDFVYDVCRDAGVNYLLTCSTLGFTTNNADMDAVLLKIDNNGDPVWTGGVGPVAKRMRVGPSRDIMESTAVNLRNNLAYSSGYFETSNVFGLTKEYLVENIHQHNGSSNTVAGVPDTKRYPKIAGPSEERRGKLYPRIAEGYYGTLYGASSSITARDALDATIIGMDDALNLQWQSNFGGEAYDYIAAVLNCSEEDDVIGVGGTRSPSYQPKYKSSSTVNYDILFSRHTTDLQFPFSNCEDPDAFQDANLSHTDNNTNVSTINLNPCNYPAVCWADSNKIPAYPQPLPLSFQLTANCVSSSAATYTNLEGYSEQVTVTECVAPSCTKNLEFAFATPMEVSFKIVDDNQFMYYYTPDASDLVAGYLYTGFGFSPGTYYWELRALDSTSGAVENHFGSFTIQ